MNPKTKNIIAWILTGLLGLQFVLASTGKLFGSMSEMFATWGYNDTFMYIIGVAELLAAIGLFIPKTRTYSIMLIIAIMLGAAYTHLTHNEASQVLVNVIVIAIAGGIWALRRGTAPAA